MAMAAALSSTATGKPQYSSAATLIVSDTAGESGLDRPGVTIRQISPARIIAPMTQNNHVPIRCPGAGTCRAATARSPAPASVTAATKIHGAEPGRGPTSRVSLGFLIASSRAAGLTGGVSVRESQSAAYLCQHT